MIHAQTLDLVKRNEDPCEEELVFLFQRQSETVDDGTENLEKLGNSVEPFSFVDKLEEDVVDRTTNIRSKVEELAVYAMQCRFQKVSFSGVF